MYTWALTGSNFGFLILISVIKLVKDHQISLTGKFCGLLVIEKNIENDPIGELLVPVSKEEVSSAQN